MQTGWDLLTGFSLVIFVRALTKVRLNHSSRPLVWGWYAADVRYWTPDSSNRCLFTWLTNSLPSSDWIMTRLPCLVISLKRKLATDEADLSVIASVQVMMYAFSEAMQGDDQHHDILGCPTSITPMWEDVLPSADDGLVCSFPVHWFCFTKAGWSKQLVDDMAGGSTQCWPQSVGHMHNNFTPKEKVQIENGLVTLNNGLCHVALYLIVSHAYLVLCLRPVSQILLSR